MSADPENEYFSDGIAEEIINALTKIQALRVASRTSAFAFKGKCEDIEEIGRKLKVATVLEGSVRKAGNKLRVTAQLVSATHGYHLWSERYDRQLEDVFAIQDEIAENIVRSLRVVLSDAEKRAIEKPATTDIEAYDYYLRGRQFFHQFRRTAIQFARRMFERAMEIDPGYALAHAGAADCCSFLYMYWDASKANLEGADAYSRKAMELRPELAEAHAARGLAESLSKRYTEAEREFETAIRLNPKLFEAHYFFGRASFQQESTLRPYATTRTRRSCGRTIIRRTCSCRLRMGDSGTRRRLWLRFARDCRLPSGTWSSIPTTLARFISAPTRWPISASVRKAWSGPTAQLPWIQRIPECSTT